MLYGTNTVLYKTVEDGLFNINAESKMLDCIIHWLCFHKETPFKNWIVEIDVESTDYHYTTDISSAIALVKHVLPGWSYRLASCSVSDDAWVQPDFNHPDHGERLKHLFEQFGDEAVFQNPVEYLDVDVDFRPPGNEARALCVAFVRALRWAREAGYITGGFWDE